jgi:hypothetical protein
VWGGDDLDPKPELGALVRYQDLWHSVRLLGLVPRRGATSARASSGQALCRWVVGFFVVGLGCKV